MNYNKSHFEIHSRFRNGIFLLAITFFVLVIVYFFYPSTVSSQVSFKELTAFQEQIDSLKQVSKIRKNKYQQKPFNPNFIKDYKGYLLGMSSKELDKLYAYRHENKWINSVAQFKEVTGVSDSLLALIAPLFKFPDWKQKTNTFKTYTKKHYPTIPFAQKKDLNTVKSALLQEKVNLPDFIADRIIKYREKLGGFVSDLQLKDVSGLYEHQKNKILSLYTVKTSKEIQKININQATVLELMNVPYFDFETALEIKDLIEKNNGISDFKELISIDGFSLEKIDRITLYLTLN